MIERELPPDIASTPLFTDRFIGVVRGEHPLATGVVTTARYASARHVHISRRGLREGLVDEALHPTGHRRDIVTVVDGFGAALALARASDLGRSRSLPETAIPGCRSSPPRAHCIPDKP
ncbi:LysR substrate-binding domain-containing protein [Nocardia asiatica]|uniref:LysR substrate-binding domain-containing protein n=1 Tax=Nocardia asiatica TaxID=209252 RepID=UPI0002F87919|nr:LysR substrate-binding domain-containing protein [Nocardia asiatica]